MVDAAGLDAVRRGDCVGKLDTGDDCEVGPGASEGSTGQGTGDGFDGISRGLYLASDLVKELVQAVEVFAKAGFGIDVGVIQNADWAVPSALDDGLEERAVEFARVDGEDFFSGILGTGHSIQVQGD